MQARSRSRTDGSHLRVLLLRLLVRLLRDVGFPEAALMAARQQLFVTAWVLICGTTLFGLVLATLGAAQ
jgi:hypothetical protein